MQIDARPSRDFAGDHGDGTSRKFCVRHRPAWCSDCASSLIGHTRQMTTRNCWLSSIALMLIQPCMAADNYPTKPVRIVVGFTPGTTTDITARALAQALIPRLGQQVIVENREGANSGIANSIVAHANPDGHTLLIGTLSLVVSPLLYKELPF